MYPSRRAIIVIAFGAALAVLPVLLGGGLWLLWLFGWCLFLLLVVFDAILSPRRSDLDVTVEHAATLFVGEPERVTVRAALRGNGRATALAKLDTWGALAASEPRRVRLSRAPVEVAFELVATRRGQSVLDSLWWRWSGPFGLIERVSRDRLERDLEAVPNLRAVRREAVRFASSREYRAGLRIERHAGEGSEFDSLREFMPGLDHRTIDWKASARHAKLLSRQFRAERNRQVVVAIDAGYLMAEPLHGLPRLDHAIHAGLLLAYFSARAGDRVGFYSFAEHPQGFSEPRTGMAAFRAALKLSGGVGYSEGETNFTLALTELMQRLNRRSLVVVMTDFVDSVTAQLMVENLTRLGRRHLVVFVSIRDPSLDELAGAEPDSLLGLHRAVVADSLVRERELVLTRLRRLGVFCIDAAPREVGVELLNRYLAVKRRELI